MRALLIVNPLATSTTRAGFDTIVRDLRPRLDLDVVSTRYRGHAGQLAAEASAADVALILTLGGDGTVNEVVNGLLGGRPDRTTTARQSLAGDAAPSGQVTSAQEPASLSALASLPALAPLPAGNANVFARSLGLPPDPVVAARQVLAAVVAGRSRSIGLGVAAGRYFTFSAGIGLDAEVIRAVERLRARGYRASSALYGWAVLSRYFAGTDRRHPALTLERAGRPPIGDLFMGVVANTTPWTYVGSIPVSPTPQAGFDSGLDVFALRHLRTLSTLAALRKMVRSDGRAPSGRSVVHLHDQSALTLRSVRPIAVHVDGEYVGEHRLVAFRSAPEAIRVLV